jgi:hypothetical protein
MQLLQERFPEGSLVRFIPRCKVGITALQHQIEKKIKEQEIK